MSLSAADRDTKFCTAFDDVLASEGIRALRLPSRSPNLNAFTERWVRSAKEECLSKLVLFWRTFAPTSPNRVCCALSRRTQSPRQAQRSALPCPCSP
jgi:hypothetical protein